MFNYDIKFLSCEDALRIKNTDLKTYKYELKKRSEESIYDAGKRNYYESRAGLWRANKPRQIKQLETKLRDKNIIFCEWTTRTYVTLIFSSGVIAYISLELENLDISQIIFDRYCVGKLSGQSVTAAIMSKFHLLLIHPDKAATLFTFGKYMPDVLCRLTDRDPHVQSLELSGGSRRAERQVSWCDYGTGVRILVWTTTVSEPAPWSPIVEDLANVHLYQITGQQATLLAYHQLEYETLSVELSQRQDNLVHVVEQVGYHKNGVSLEWVRYNVPSGDRANALSTQRESAVCASLSTSARVVRRSLCDTRLAVACIDGSLHILHHIAGLTHSTNVGFIVSAVRWAGDLVLAAEEGGRLQCFDRALSSLHHHTKCLDISSFILEARRMQVLATRDVRGGTVVLTSFSGGPLTLIRITHPRLLTAWMRSGRYNNAVSLLRALDWEHEGCECLWATTRIIQGALRMTGGETHVEAALGAFLAPPAPHSPGALRYAPHVHDLARKFFHHLLRRGSIEKALSLAVDLCAWDLFADARWAARRRGLTALAEEADALAASYAQAQESESSESCSECSSHSCCSASDEEPSTSKAIKNKPSPLPHIALPPQPTIIPVPRAQNEPISTNSIRPNLHQYLERDNTIWNTDLKQEKYNRITHEYPSSTLNDQSVKWHSVENVLVNYKHGLSKHNSALAISESVKPTHMALDLIPKPPDERLNMAHFRNLFQAELQEAHSTIYNYYSKSYSTNSRLLTNIPEKPNKSNGEKNKVKFSDTVTVAVVSEPSLCPEPARELADSLPICGPHNYLAAFAQHAPPAPAPAPAPETPPQRPPKIKVVHFGMV